MMTDRKGQPISPTTTITANATRLCLNPTTHIYIYKPTTIEKQHPERVTELILRGIFMLRRKELLFYYQVYVFLIVAQVKL